MSGGGPTSPPTSAAWRGSLLIGCARCPWPSAAPCSRRCSPVAWSRRACSTPRPVRFLRAPCNSPGPRSPDSKPSAKIRSSKIRGANAHRVLRVGDPRDRDQATREHGGDLPARRCRPPSPDQPQRRGRRRCRRRTAEGWEVPARCAVEAAVYALLHLELEAARREACLVVRRRGEDAKAVSVLVDSPSSQATPTRPEAAGPVPALPSTAGSIPEGHSTPGGAVVKPGPSANRRAHPRTGVPRILECFPTTAWARP